MGSAPYLILDYLIVLAWPMSTNSLVLLFNVPVHPEAFRWKWKSSLQRVCGLHSGADSWLPAVVERVLYDYRVVGVPLSAGYAHDVHAPEVLKCLLAIIHPTLTEQELGRGDNVNCQVKSAWHNCRVGSIVHVAENVDANLFQDMRYDHILGLFELESKLGVEISDAVQAAFCTAARAQLQEMERVGEYNKNLRGPLAVYYGVAKFATKGSQRGSAAEPYTNTSTT